MRVPESWIRPVRGTRWVYYNHPLPPGVAGGGAVEIAPGEFVPIYLYGGNSVIDRRRLKRMFRQLYRAQVQHSGDK